MIVNHWEEIIVRDLILNWKGMTLIYIMRLYFIRKEMWEDGQKSKMYREAVQFIVFNGSGHFNDSLCFDANAILRFVRNH